MSETLFKKVDYNLSHLVHDIDHGEIGLPDIQRPFVWKASQVRDLFDSMYRGFPVGYLLFWSNDQMKGVKQIGSNGKQAAPHLLIVDGQQRLTSLYAVLKGSPVLDSEYRKTELKIAFHPPTERFEVADAAIRKDPEFIPDISTVFGGQSSFKVVSQYLQRMSEALKEGLSDSDEQRYAHAIDRLFDLQNYPFTALVIAATVDEQQVADIFVRINSKGVKLNRADFILTLMSVFWDEGRQELENFSRKAKHYIDDGRPSPFNHLFQPDADHMLRATVAFGFKRAVLRNVYTLLRGKDVETGEFVPTKRDEQFQVLAEKLPSALDLTAWHEFLKAINAAGYRSARMVTSQNALAYAYAIFLIGRNDCGVNSHILRSLVGRWFFASSLTSRLSGSFESMMEAELGRLQLATSAKEFENEIEHTISLTLTDDYWNTILSDALTASVGRTPSLYGFYASQCVLKSPVLFSALTVWELLDPALKSKKSNLDRHHLFPRAYLKSIGIDKRRQINQIANMTFLEWPENISIGAKPPSIYVPELRERFNPQAWDTMCQDHGLPENWWTMDYEEFLSQRRQLMAAVIRRAYESL